MAARVPVTADTEDGLLRDAIETPSMLLAAFEPVEDLPEMRRDDVEAIACAEDTTRKLHDAFLTTGLLGVSAPSDNSMSIRNLRIFSVVALCGGIGTTDLGRRHATWSSLSLTDDEALSVQQRVLSYRGTPELEEPPPKEGKREAGARAGEGAAAVRTLPQLRERVLRTLNQSSGMVPSIKIQEETWLIAQSPAQGLQQQTLDFARTKAQPTIKSLDKRVSRVNPVFRSRFPAKFLVYLAFCRLFAAQQLCIDPARQLGINSAGRSDRRAEKYPGYSGRKRWQFLCKRMMPCGPLLTTER